MNATFRKSDLHFEQTNTTGYQFRPVEPSDVDVHPSYPLHLVAPEGQLEIHSAPYRGSFSLVMSAALRAAGLGSKVMVIQFLKGGVNQGENGIVHLCGNLQWLRPNVEACLSSPAQDVPVENQSCGNKNAVKRVWEIAKQHLSKGDLDRLVLDEIGLAIVLGYLNEAEVMASLKARKHSMDIIITGPSIPPKIVDIADQVTELRSGV